MASSSVALFQPQVALCFSGQLRGAEERVGELREAKAAVQGLGPTQVFASIHLNDSPGHPLPESEARAVVLVVRTLSPAAWETYDSGEYACAPRSCRGDGGGGNNRQKQQVATAQQPVPNIACTFLVQFAGVRRSFRLMVDYEHRTGSRFDVVVRYRFDISCVHWGSLASSYPSLSLPPPSTPTASDQALWFLGSSRRSSAQQVSEYDWTDLAFVVSRGLAETVFTSVDEYSRSTSSYHGRRTADSYHNPKEEDKGEGGEGSSDCLGPLMHSQTLERECAAAAVNGTTGLAVKQCEAATTPQQRRNRKKPPSSLLLTRCKFFECVVNARIRRVHGPSAAFLNPATSQWRCGKNTRHHDKVKKPLSS